MNMVGLNGLEPSTSRLSGVRSNQLSYRPIFNIYCAFKVAGVITERCTFHRPVRTSLDIKNVSSTVPRVAFVFHFFRKVVIHPHRFVLFCFQVPNLTTFLYYQVINCLSISHKNFPDFVHSRYRLIYRPIT